MTISIRLYAKKDEHDLYHSSSIGSLGPLKQFSFLNIGKKSSLNINDSTFMSYNNVEKFPANPSNLGNLLGEFVKNIEPLLAFNKVSGTYPLVSDSKKDIGQIQLQLGLFSDCDYNPLPPLSSEFKEFSGIVSFELLTAGGVVFLLLIIGFRSKAY